jgi:holin-like protein
MLAKLALLMGFQLAGEAIVKGLGVTFPGPLCGMLLLLVYLFATGGPSKELAGVATTLIDHLGLLFVPAGTAIVAYGALFASDGLAVMLALLVSTTVAIHVNAIVVERVSAARRREADLAAA